MHLWTSMIADLSFSDPSLWIVLSSVLLIMLLFLLFGRHYFFRNESNEIQSFEMFRNTDLWIQDQSLPDERRRSVRRSGMPTAIHLLDISRSKKPQEAFVLDRSTGGVRIAVSKICSIGSILQIRPHHCDAETPWVKIIVRSCREIGDYFEIGCQFEAELPWNILLLFG